MRVREKMGHNYHYGGGKRGLMGYIYHYGEKKRGDNVIQQSSLPSNEIDPK
jgi:hypothetical protein